MNSVKSEILDLNRERLAFLGQHRKEENVEEKNLLCCPEFWPQMVGMLWPVLVWKTNKICYWYFIYPTPPPPGAVLLFIWAQLAVS